MKNSFIAKIICSVLVLTLSGQPLLAAEHENQAQQKHLLGLQSTMKDFTKTVKQFLVCMSGGKCDNERQEKLVAEIGNLAKKTVYLVMFLGTIYFVRLQAEALIDRTASKLGNAASEIKGTIGESVDRLEDLTTKAATAAEGITSRFVDRTENIVGTAAGEAKKAVAGLHGAATRIEKATKGASDEASRWGVGLRSNPESLLPSIGIVRTPSEQEKAQERRAVEKAQREFQKGRKQRTGLLRGVSHYVLGEQVGDQLGYEEQIDIQQQQAEQQPDEAPTGFWRGFFKAD